MKSAPLIFLLFIIFINALGSSFGEDFKAVNCNGVDEIQCSRLKSEEGKRVNDVNAKIVSSALEGCKPVKINVYQGVKVIRTTEIVGKIGDKCKMVLAQTTMPVQQVCLLDEVAVRLMRKDPKIQIPEEQSQGCGV